MDTINQQIDTVLHKIITDENVYKTILTEQHETYEFIIYMFLGIIGLILGMSLLLNYYLFNKKIESEVNDRISSLEKELTTNITNSIQSKFDTESINLKNDLELHKNEAKGGLMFLQGNTRLQLKVYSLALDDYYNALGYYSDANQKANLLRILKICSERCIPHMNSLEIENLENLNNRDFTKLYSRIQQINENGELTDAVNEFKKEIELARKRIPEVQN